MAENKWLKHPCFDESARNHFSRVHLPVAPRCNVQCMFCDRKYDCVNESRPGVSSVVLTPEQSLVYLERVMGKIERVSVVGIAGPGDPLANPQETLQTLRLVREQYPQILLCLATNGLALPQYAEELADLLVSHVTVTVNAVDPAVGEPVYAWVRDGKKIYRGREAAALLLERQLAGIRILKRRGITVKINFILIPGLNDRHVSEVARTMADLGAEIFNVMPLIPAEGSAFAHIEAPSAAMTEQARVEAGQYLLQMKHCGRCRADAVGIIGREMDENIIRDLQECARLPRKPVEERPYVAAATMEGVLVNQHLGKSEEFRVYAPDGSGEYICIDTRKAPPAGGGDERWSALADLFRDCRAVLVNAAGQRPVSLLRSSGVEVVEMDGLVEQGLEYVFKGADLPGRRMEKGCGCGQEKKGGEGCEKKGCASGCSGSGLGCL